MLKTKLHTLLLVAVTLFSNPLAASSTESRLDIERLSVAFEQERGEVVNKLLAMSVVSRWDGNIEEEISYREYLESQGYPEDVIEEEVSHFVTLMHMNHPNLAKSINEQYEQLNVLLGSAVERFGNQFTCLDLNSIFIKTLQGVTYTFRVSLDTTILELKEFIAERLKISVDKQRIVFAGRVLCDEKTLRDYNVHPESTLHLVIGPAQQQ